MSSVCFVKYKFFPINSRGKHGMETNHIHARLKKNHTQHTVDLKKLRAIDECQWHCNRKYVFNLQIFNLLD